MARAIAAESPRETHHHGSGSPERWRTKIDAGEDTKRDHLAFVRTILALERTVLAYLRTALAFLAVGVAVAHFFPGEWFSTWMLTALASLVGAAGIYRGVRVARRLRHMRAQLRAAGPGPPTVR